MADALDSTPLANAVQGLADGIARYQRDITDTQIRDGLVQRFEFTCEISHKMLKRWAGDWPTWKRYREMRSRTSHTCDETIALQVVSAIPEFLDEARFLMAQLQGRLQAPAT